MALLPLNMTGASNPVSESEQYLSAILDATPVATFVLDADQAIRRANPAAGSILGLEVEELVGQRLDTLIRGNLDWEECAARTCTGEICCSNGDCRDVVLGRNPFEEGWVVTMQDVTRQRAVERQLERAQRSESLGRLAGGIAHDFNNLLLSTFANAEFLREEVEDQPEALELVEEIIDVARRAKALTTQLLIVGRQDGAPPADLVMGTVLRQSKRMLERLLPETIRLHLNVERGLGVHLAESQLQQLIVNLVVNARDAIGERGNIWIRARRGPDGKSALLEVADDGVGIDARDESRIFEPFFTTKAGKGTGLGLATVHSIVTGAGGALRVETLRDPTTISVTLPLVKSSGRSARKPPLDGHAMLVEDDDAVRASVERQLQRVIKRVTAFRQPREALEYAREDLPDVVVTDVVMPDMTGPELISKIREAGLDTPVIYMSGHADPELIQLGIRLNHARFLAKPLHPRRATRRD